MVITDPLELKFPALGLVELEDPETGDRSLVDTSEPRIRTSFARAMAALRDDRLRLFKKLELDAIEVNTQEDYAVGLQRFFRRRSLRAAM